MNEQSSFIHVLVVSPVDADLVILSNLIGHSAWTFESAANAAEAKSVLRDGHIQVVLCDSQLPDADWKKVLEMAQAQPHPPEVIVISRIADEALWAEVLNLGAWDVLLKPFRGKEVYDMVHNAWRHWTCAHTKQARRKVASEDGASQRAIAIASSR